MIVKPSTHILSYFRNILYIHRTNLKANTSVSAKANTFVRHKRILEGIKTRVSGEYYFNIVLYWTSIVVSNENIILHKNK